MPVGLGAAVGQEGEHKARRRICIKQEVDGLCCVCPRRPSPRSSLAGHHICSPLLILHPIQPCIQHCSKNLPPLLLHPSQSAAGAGRAEGNPSLVPGRFCALTFPPSKRSRFQEADCVGSLFPTGVAWLVSWCPAVARAQSQGLPRAVGRAGGSHSPPALLHQQKASQACRAAQGQC